VKKLIIPIAMLSLLSVAISCVGQGAKEPAYVSKKPLYANVALCEDGSKVLTLAFDESEGTGEGYDTIYADLNFNGDLTDDKAIRGTFRKAGSSSIGCYFPPIGVDVPYNEKGKGIETPCQILIRYYQFRTRVATPEQSTRANQIFSLRANIRLKHKGGIWEYGWASRLSPAEKPEEAPVLSGLGAEPVVLRVEARPDRRKERHLGIGAHLISGTRGISCSKSNTPIKARVQIKNQRGKLVHSQGVRLDKLFFG